MAKISILVTGVGGDVGQSIIKCLRGSDYNLKLVGCDMDTYAGGRIMVDNFEQAPKADNQMSYLSFIKEIVEKYQIEYIYPVSEVEIAVFSQYRDYFSESLVVFINNSFTIDTFSDKYETVLFLKNCGLSYPTTYLMKEYDGQLDYPVLIKARRGWGSKGLIWANDLEEIKFYKDRYLDAIVQERLGTVDGEYTVGVFSDRTNVYSICFRRYLGYGSLSKYVELVESSEMQGIAEAIARACELEGCMNVQFRKTDRGYIPFEVNARISSTAYFRHCFGFKDVKWWLDIKQNKLIKYIPQYQMAIGVRVMGEVFFRKEQ